ncbi:amidase family protein [Autumnicola psychrophila]|uniref:Amidase family protein n=1 Tax=Autumnicola psychrophila TaxID=3075592 RepID=A0ABU3DSY1_9FLAO|nr:amidase family protein [Zunongwangia sp. F225]MDT0686743.1 amidase family protein [Zunongwangia sp. F225]
MKKIILVFLAFLVLSCADNKKNEAEQPVQDTINASEEPEYLVLDSKFINKDSLMAPFAEELANFSEERYSEVKPLIFDQNIPEIQNAIQSGALTYEELALFYLKRIQKFDRNNSRSLNSVIFLNPNLLKEARAKDQASNEGQKHPIFGIPVLLKDNINTENMPTTAGAVALQNNQTDDAFIVEKLKENGALILGKANLSEWAYFFCGECPSGYSAVGGQTLNPYGRKILDTGGSSSGSAVAVAANLAPVAVGSETSGSILSPSSQNSVVGLKPTIGVLSRSGIIPISSTLDTPGPITKSVIDNAILLSAMAGNDPEDPTTKNTTVVSDYYTSLENSSLDGKRFGAIEGLMEDSLYVRAVNDLKNAGAEVIVYKAEEIELPNFLRLLNLDMKKDLPAYFQNYGGELEVSSVEDVYRYNTQDSLTRAPYGQSLFEGIMKDSATEQEFTAVKDTLRLNGREFFDVPMQEHNLDAIISINNYHAGYAAVAQYPGITVPMGYGEDGAPRGLTIFAKPFEEQQLLKWAGEFETVSQRRISPENYNY